jgi:hypothetical protein
LAAAVQWLPGMVFDDPSHGSDIAIFRDEDGSFQNCVIGDTNAEVDLDLSLRKIRWF